MKNRKLKYLTLFVVLAAILTLGACKKKVAPPPPPPPPPPAAPTASLSASPDTIQPGQSATLSWQTTNATDVTIDGRKVDPNGQRSVTPSESTTYRLNAKGPGGTQEATARVTVMSPPEPPAPPAPSATEEEMFAQNVKDIFFDYDKYDLRPDQTGTAQSNARWLAQHPNIRFTIEGHCDERGSTEYNIALGDNRAQAVKNALTQAGVPAANARTISFGKEKPFCTESTEDCWQQNRRAHFVYQK